MKKPAHLQKSREGLSGLTVLTLATLAITTWLDRKAPGKAKPQRATLPSAKAPAVPSAAKTRTEGGEGSAAGGGDAVPVDHPPGLIGIGQSIFLRFSRDNATLTAAGIAFYLLLSIFPGLAALVSVYGLFGDPAEVGKQIAPFAGLLPPEAMKLLNQGLEGFIRSSADSHMSLALITSLLLALWSARAAMSSIMVGLTVAYEEADKRSFVIQTLISLALTIGAVAFAVIAIFAIAVLPAVLALVRLDKTVEAALVYGRWPLLAALVVLGFAVLFRFAPYRSHPRWRWISWGSSVSTLLWLLGSFAFSFYVGHFGSYDATYGSLGAVVILLLWFWVSSLVMILGAEIDSELDLRATNGGSPVAGTPPSAGPPKRA